MSQIRIFFTSHRLISATSYVNHVNLDGTYKFIWNEFPVIMISTTDRRKNYHPFGLALVKGETSSDNALICTSLKQAVEKSSNLSFHLLNKLLMEVKLYQIDSQRHLVNLTKRSCFRLICLGALAKILF